MTIKKVKLKDISKSRGRTDKEQLDKLTDAQIAEAVLGDKDAVVPTEKELEEFSKPKPRESKDDKKN